jgi:hypothetical protein
MWFRTMDRRQQALARQIGYQEKIASFYSVLSFFPRLQTNPISLPGAQNTIAQPNRYNEAEYMYRRRIRKGKERDQKAERTLETHVHN